MKNKFIILVILLSIIYPNYSLLKAQEWTKDLTDKQFLDLKELEIKFDNYWKDKTDKKHKGYKQFVRWLNFWKPRLYPNLVFPDDRQIISNALRSIDPQKSNKMLSEKADWKELGPIMKPLNRLPYISSGLGRINCIRFNPSNPDIVFAGSSSGGLWKSTSGGYSWINDPFTDVMSIGISDICFAADNPNIIYLVTGDADGYQMSRGFSVGILKSTDGGSTWNFTGKKSNIESNDIIASILVNPNNSDIVYAGTSSGLYQSTDGGASWNKKLDGIYIRDLKFKPGNPAVIYSASSINNGSSKIYKSTDVGDSWNVIKSFTNTNRIALDVSDSKPENLYALCSSASGNDFQGFYLSSDEGSNWETMSISPNILGIDPDGMGTGGQGNYDLTIKVMPGDPNTIFIGGIHIWKSTDTGKTWELINHWTGSYGKPFVHADQHDLEYRPNTSTLFSCNDGGISKSADAGKTWEDISAGLGIAQFYRFGLSQTIDNRFIGGTQDNGVHYFNGSTWNHVIGGDGMECAIDPINSDYMYGCLYYGALYRSSDAGNNFSLIFNPDQYSESAGWTAPFQIDPEDSKTIYIGCRNIWKSTNRGNNWTKISNFTSSNPLDVITISAKDHNFMYASFGNLLYYSQNGGTGWSPLWSAPAYISSVSVDDKDPLHIWVSLSGYIKGQKIFEYSGGKWINISDSLPNVPVNCIIQQRNTSYKLFAATDIGVFTREPGSAQWDYFGNGMPPVVVSELEIQYKSGILRAATFGRGIWETKIYNCNIVNPNLIVTGDSVLCGDDSLFCEVEQDYSKYTWSNGLTGKKIKITNGGNYFCVVENPDGCTAISRNIVVPAYTVLKIRIKSSEENPFCEGDTLLLTAQSIGFRKFLWSTGDTLKSIIVSQPVKITLEGETANGCKSYDTLDLKTKPLPPEFHIVQEKNVLIAPNAAKYQWYFGDYLLKNDTSQRLTAGVIGRYYVRITAENGCSRLSNPYTVYTSALENENIKGLTIFPNPGTGVFNIIIGNSDVFQADIDITDVIGNRIITYKQTTFERGRLSIDLSSISNGVYFIKISTGVDTFIGKIIKY